MLKTCNPPVSFLLAVWGKNYIQNFFDFSLRSLLAQGNIPALSKEFECTFIFLTQESDVTFFQTQPAFSQLKKYCQIEFVDISDLIFDGSYSATLTLAYERGMRSRGNEMCQTYFFYLVADYVISDGSLKNIGKYLKAGYSGITAGNFLVVEEYVAPLLKNKMACDPEGVIAIKSRDMLKLSFPHMHPVSLGHTVTQSFTHAKHANRLFWKVDDTTLIGRFYLRHMLCIKPEIDDYRIGSSCDYSFIPEMCPSNKVIHIQDSDEYCVMEMAPFDYEQQWLAPGPHHIDTLAAHLSSWTTHVHRANAYFPVIYHSEELSDSHHAILEKSAAFIKDLESRFSSTPQPVRGHFYWNSCIEIILNKILTQKNTSLHYRQGVLAGILGSPTFSPDWHDDRSLLKTSQNPLFIHAKKRYKANLHAIMVSATSRTFPWNLHWMDERPMQKDVIKKMTLKGSCMVITFEPMGEILQWFEKDYPGKCTYQLFELLQAREHSDFERLFHNHQQALIWVTAANFCKLGFVLRLCEKYLPKNSPISVYVTHKHTLKQRYFKQIVNIWQADLMHTQMTCESVETYSNPTKSLLESPYLRYYKKLFAPRKHLWTRGIGFIGLFLLNLTCLFANLIAFAGCVPRKKLTSAILQFKTLS